MPGVTVGHATLIEGDTRTGVTAVVPHDGNLFRDKPAAACVLNGFGKSTGRVQVNEPGTLETPILLTNTFAVGTCGNALIRRAIAADPDIGSARGQSRWPPQRDAALPWRSTPWPDSRPAPWDRSLLAWCWIGLAAMTVLWGGAQRS